MLSWWQTFNTLLIVHSVAFQIFSSRLVACPPPSRIKKKHKCFLSTRASLLHGENSFQSKKDARKCFVWTMQKSNRQFSFSTLYTIWKAFFSLALTRFLTYSIKSIQLYVEWSAVFIAGSSHRQAIIEYLRTMKWK